jgi:dihydrofolate synthase/folylpolyglutamate synthase
MNYSQSLLYLEKIQEKIVKLTLSNIKKAINHLPFSIKNINFIQVAGTNGKGSTSHFITSILQAAGFRVGLFTSPHLQDIRERITINKQWITEAEFAESLTAVKGMCEDLDKKKLIDNIPTFFETLFLLAIHYFYRNKVDFAVFEVGLGGRLDATSTITPRVSVITNISYDHTKTLGKRIRDIAVEKAGIIKKNIPVICGCQRKSISRKIIQEISKKRNAPFHDVLVSEKSLQIEEKPQGYRCTFVTELNRYQFEIHLNGKHQVMNAATAIRTIEILKTRGFHISSEAITEGVEKNFVPGRIEIINTFPQIILDGGHNVAGIASLVQFLDQKHIKDLTLIFGVLGDKNYRKMISLLMPYIGRVVITEPLSDRALPAEKLIKFFNQKETRVMKNIRDALETAKTWAGNILVTGSLYLVGEMRNIIFGGASHE